MARKQVVSPKSPRTHLRQTPYTLPHRRPPGLHVPYEPPPRSWEEQHYDLTRSRTLSPHRSPSRGPPTPESPGLISPDTFYPAAFSPASEGYQLSPPPGTAYTDGPTGFHFIGHNRLSLGPFDCSTPPPYSAWPGQSQSVAILTPSESSSSSLAGIQTSPETDSFVHLVEFPNGPSPTRLQRLPQAPGPWSQYPFRQDDLMKLDESSPSSHSSALSPASSSGPARRRGPLTHDGRRNANQVRDIGACLRCICMKERCDNSDPCQNCDRKKGRKWKLGCLRKNLDQMAPLFFPSPIQNRYNVSGTNQYIDGTAFSYLMHRPYFALKLSMGVGGPPLEVTVREVEPLNHKRILQSFQINRENGSIHTRPTWDPPIVPYTTNKKAFVDNLFTQLAWSMKEVFERKHESGYYWPYKCFEGMPTWVGEVAEKIHEFHHNAETLKYFHPIRQAHTVLYFNYMLDHPLAVKDHDHISDMVSNLENKPDADDLRNFINPETIGRFVKASIFPKLVKVTTELLKTLHDTLMAMATAKAKDTVAGGSNAQRDLVFSLSFMLLIIVGQTQSRLLLLSELSKSEAHIKLPLEEARNHIDEIEKGLAYYIIYFHDFVIKKRARPSRTNPNQSLSPTGDPNPEEAYSANFKLMLQVEELTRKYQNERPKTFGRPPLNYQQFDKDNVHRLCWNFVETIFGTGE